MKKVTIKDLARITGYSKSTVSYALNDKEGVGEEARREIIRHAKALGYIPNFHARSIASGSSRTIGVILRDLTNPFYANVFCAIDKIATEHNYQTIFYNLGGDPTRTRKGIELMRSMMVSGIILDFYGNDEEIEEELVQSSIPTVVFGMSVTADLSCVQTDDEEGARSAVDYGVGCGYRDVFYVTSESKSLINLGRENAIRERVRAYGLPFGNNVVYVPQGGEAADVITDRCPKDSLLICYNDILACAVVNSLMKRKLYVPGDYAVIGFDNINILPYSLTTVEIPQYEMAEQAVRQLFRLMDGNGENKKITLQSRLIVRDTVKNLTKKD